MVAVHQILPVFAPRDAIGNHVVAVRNALRGMGLRSEIYAGEVNAGAGNGATSIRKYRGSAHGEPALLMYHASTGSAVADWFAARPERKLIDYHNISPADLMAPWEPHVAVELDHGRRQLSELAGVTEWALADSTYNERELLGLGYGRTAVVPILVDTAALGRGLERPRGHDWLFVSRLLPHKAHHDVVKAFAAYHAAYDDEARLHLVGAVGSARYADALSDFIEDLGLASLVELTGSVPAGELEILYRTAGVYVALSDHEGFGVPLLEAMAHDLPVVTYACTAVPETVGDGALLLEDKRPTLVAAAAHRVLSDPELRASLVAAGRRRLDVFSLAASTARLRAVIDEILAPADRDGP